MPVQTRPLPASALSATDGLENWTALPQRELSAGGRQAGPIALHSPALGLVVLIHGLALAAGLAWRSEAVPDVADRAIGSVTISLIPPRPTTAPASPAPREARSASTEPAHRERVAPIPDEAPAPPRSEATLAEAPAAAPPPSAAPQAAAPQAPPGASEAQRAPREMARLNCIVPEPEYPARSRRRGESGRVVMRIAIDERGVVSQTRLVRSSGYPALDQAAQRAALQASCAPHIENGKALAVSALQSFKFEWAD